MIVRDAKLTNTQRVLYESAPAPLVLPAAVSDTVAQDLPSTLPVTAAATPVAAPVIDSVTQVIEWLASQDATTRASVASVLAEDLTALRTEAMAAGRAAGELQAAADFAAACEHELHTLRALVQQAEAQLTTQCEQLTALCADIVGTVLTQLVGTQLDAPHATLTAVRQAIAHVVGMRRVTIGVHAKDLAALQTQQAALTELFGSQHLTLVADERVTTGGCLLETSLGTVDARWETQLTAVAELLRASRPVVESPP